MDLKVLMQKCLLDARAICDQAEKESRDFTTEEREKVGNLLAEAQKLKDQLKSAAGDAALRAAVLELGGGIELAERPAGHQRGYTPGRGQSLGEQFVASPEFQSWMKGIAPNGVIPESRKGLSSPAIEFKDLITGLSDISAGVFVSPEQSGIYEPLGRYPLVLRDLIAVRQTTSDMVEFVRQTKQFSEATPVPEANVKYPTGATGEITGTKPQASWYAERVSAPVKTIAVYAGVTKRALADAAQIRGIIDQELREDLDDSLENQLFNGDGIGENFTGLVNTAGTLIQAFNTDQLVTCRQAITTLLLTGRTRPTAWLFHPTDWEGIELLRDLVGRFFRGDPFGAGPSTLWGVPVVQSYHQAPGSAWLANWRKMVLWDRMQSTISVTDSHSDWFIRNLVAILAELRAAMGIIRPAAFVNVELS
jgi:HK97 family phage major capsid protein